MTVPNPFSGFPEQDYVLIEGERSPGQVRVNSPNSPRPWDIRKGYATSGATVVPAGDDLAKFELIFEIWDEADTLPWRTYAAKYFDKAARFTPGSLTPKALGIDHPLLKGAPIRITQFVLEDVIDHGTDDDGLWTITVQCLQYRRPKPAFSKPDAAIPAAAKAAPTAVDAQDREIQTLQAQMAGLQGAP